jgi:hypothetical protein
VLDTITIVTNLTQEVENMQIVKPVYCTSNISLTIVQHFQELGIETLLSQIQKSIAVDTSNIK